MPDVNAAQAQHDDSNNVVDFNDAAAEKAQREADDAAEQRAQVIALTDTGNAAMFARQYHDRVRYEPDSKSWYVYTGHYWAKGGKAAQLAFRYVTELVSNLTASSGAEEAWRKQSLSSRGIKNTLAAAQSHEQILVDVDQFDADPYALNTPGGIVDLQTGEMRASDPAELHSRSTAVTPDRELPTPQWDNFLDRTFGGDQELIRYMQTLVGLMLIGAVLEPVLPLFYGRGRNGKSTLIGVLQGILGVGDNGYSVQAEPKLLTSKEAHPTGVAALQGARLAACSELAGNEKFNEPLLKMLTGSDLITARKMRQDFTTFKPTASLILASNDRPDIENGGPALWSRVQEFPFSHTVPDGEQVKNLKEILIGGEGPGILAWAIEGSVSYLQVGKLNPPASVLAATKDYQRSTDPLQQFVEEECTVGTPGQQGMSVSLTEFHAAYEKWCEEEGHEPLTKTMRTQRLERDYGVIRKKGRARRYDGIRLGQSWVPEGMPE